MAPKVTEPTPSVVTDETLGKKHLAFLGVIIIGVAIAFYFFQKSSVTPPERSVVVRVPVGTGPAVARRWAELPANERVTFLTHRVAKGETLSGIAQRYGVSTTLLQAANPKAKPRSLRVGQELTVPLSPGAQRGVAPARRVAASPPRAATSGYHTVRSGDSLWTISQRYGVKVGELPHWNTLDGTLLRVGQQLRVQAH